MNEKEIEGSLKSLLYAVIRNPEIEIIPLPQSGSNRLYYRLTAGTSSYVGTYVPDAAEGECFVRLAGVFKKMGMSVPEVYRASSDFRFYIQEDLGERSLFSELHSQESETLIKKTLKCLIELQKTPESAWSSICMSKPFGIRQIMWDLNYFKYEFLKPKEVIFDEDKLEEDFQHLSQKLTSIPDEFMGFMMRDCQSRNVMIADQTPVFIDFQGGRKGPVLYDAVSMLWQARAGFDKEFRNDMLDYYSSAFCEGNSRMKKDMLASLNDLVLFRTLQVLGAYGFRGLIQNKAHFLLSIPGALSNLRELLDEGGLDEYKELKRCSEALIAESNQKSEEKGSSLKVEIFSFSYKKGYPKDLSGNGGGFMFDCRALHNPGRYPQYRLLTGRDNAVVDFLEKRGEIQSFLKSAWSLTDPAIERYISRGFTNLQIGFGCTGGQHRSVYSAEKTAAHIRAKFPEVTVHLIHQEHPE